MKRILFILFTFIFTTKFIIAFSFVEVGLDRIFVEKEFSQLLKNKKIGLLSHSAAINREGKHSFEVFLENKDICSLQVVFTLEHGFYGDVHVDSVQECFSLNSVPIFDYLKFFQNPNQDLLKDLDVVVVDIQDTGTRCYTFVNILYKCMQECEKNNISVIVLDRPNPINGLVIDGPIVSPGWESLVGTEGLPLCHGMTIAELAKFFQKERSINCNLHIVSMRGWKRSMSFEHTLRTWVPTSPQIPEASTAIFYPVTGLIGHCSLANIGIGYTLPFKVVAAPWIDELTFVRKLNEFKLSGVTFIPFRYTPFFGKFKNESCKGVYLIINDHKYFCPVETQFVIMGVLKAMYPKQFEEAINLMLKMKPKTRLFNQIMGGPEVLEIITKKQFITWPLLTICREAREKFKIVRQPYLIKDYED